MHRPALKPGKANRRASSQWSDSLSTVFQNGQEFIDQFFPATPLRLSADAHGRNGLTLVVDNGHGNGQQADFQLLVDDGEALLFYLLQCFQYGIDIGDGVGGERHWRVTLEKAALFRGVQIG